MRARSAAVSAVVLVTVVPLAAVTSSATASAAVQPGAAAAAALAPGVTAYYEMNESAGTTVMRDSGPNGLDAPVNPTGITSGATFDGATGYNWVHRAPEAAPPSPERVVQVPDNPNLEPGNGPFTIELRYRTKENFGNITQKGQAQSKGGQWKIQAPGGVPSCLFSGSDGQVATGAMTPLNDEQWHDLTCVLTSAGVTMYVDGQFRNRKNGPTGTIDNGIPMTVGGKINCDQIAITCDYFSGQIDFIKISKAANLPPSAAFGSSCFGLSCSFDSSSSADADGSIVRYAWDFGDGTTSTAAKPAHTYAAAGSYNVRLTVTDNEATTAVKTTATVVADAPPIESPVEFVGSAAAQANNTRATVAIPAAVSAGDRLLLVLSYNNLARTVGTPTGVTGWTRLDDVTASTMGTVAFTKVAQAGDAGASVAVPLSGNAKYTLTAAAYAGAVQTPGVAFARSTNVSTTSTRTTPAVNVPLGAWVVSYWADKSGTTTAWTPAAATARRSICGADAGRICSLLGDTGAPLPPGPAGSVAASTNAASAMATMWSFVLAPDTGGPPVNDPPTAAFDATCTLLACAFDSSDSGDTDGSITSYAWAFGDGDTSTAANPDHVFDLAGSYHVTLTVTDDAGGSDLVTHTFDVSDAPAQSPVAYVGSAVAAANTANPSASLPTATAAGDRLVLALSLNNTARTFTSPSGGGWTLLNNIVADDMRTAVWTKVATAGTGGSTVSVPLSGTAKVTITLAVYTGVDATTAGLPFASAIDTGKHAPRQTPAVNAPDRAWVISYWADKSGTTTSWTPPASVTGRQQACGVDAGRICSLFADSGHSVPAGSYPGLSASTNAPSAKATVWAIVLPPAP